MTTELVHTERQPIRYLPNNQIPTWLRDVPAHVLFFRRSNEGCAILQIWLDRRGLPRPTLLELESERRARGGDHRRARNRRPGDDRR